MKYERKDEPVRSCAGCGAAIFWVITPYGKRMPVSVATGESHFADCPMAKGFRKGKKK